MKIIKMIFILVTILMFTNCATYKPDSDRLIGADRNGRYIIKNPHYQKRINAIGVSSIVVSTLAGGYGGYKSNLVTYYNDGQKMESMKYVDAGIGALVGFSVSYLANYLIGGINKQKNAVNPQKWMKLAKINDDYSFIEKGYGDFKIIDNTFESKFYPNNMADVTEFRKAFGEDSKYLDDVILNSLPNITRSQVLHLINRYPKTKNMDKLKYAYIDKSNNVRDLFSAKEQFPDIKYDYVRKAKSLIDKLNDFVVFSKYYPEKIFDENLMKQLIDKSTNKFALSEFIKLKVIKANKKLQKRGKIRYIQLSEGYSDLKIALGEYPDAISEKIPDLTNIKDCIAFYKKVILPLELNQKVKEDYKTAFKFAFFPSIKNNRNKILQFFQNSPYPSFVNNEESIKSLGEKLSEKEGEYYYYRDKLYGYIFSSWGSSKEYSYYKGGIKNGKRNGKGKVVNTKDGYYYDGDWVDNSKHGKGKEYKPGWNTYTGGFKHGLKHGEGFIKWEKGTKWGDVRDWFQGTFKNGHKHGYGEMRTRDGFRIYGNYINGLEDGTFIIKKWTLMGLVSDEYRVDFQMGKQLTEINQTEFGLTNFRSGVGGNASSGDREPDSNLSEADKVVADGVPSVSRTGELTERYGLWNGTYKGQEIRFEDGVSGEIYLGGDSNKWFLDPGLGPNSYYDSKNDVLKALYYYKRIGAMPSKSIVRKLRWK